MKKLKLSLMVSALAGLGACSQTERNFGRPLADSGAQMQTEKDASASPLEMDSGLGVAEGDGGELAISCDDDDDCDDDNPCNGDETCSDDNRCVQGTRLDDGTACSSDPNELLICLRGNCVLSECGDGQLAPYGLEECDDGDDRPGDGCEPDCTYTCTEDEHCYDGNPCNGAETCNAEAHTCVTGEQLDDNTSCGDERICSSGRCVPEGCGNGTREEGEDCDDGNLDDGDGCDSDCTFSCTTDLDCSDGSVCTGVETCDEESHTCVPGERLDCDDDDPCTRNECDPEFGCWNPLIDEDNDGHADQKLGACGDDCDDNDATVYAGAAELCDEKDNNCNGEVDETAPVWYRDCDGDGYANASAMSLQQCEQPGPAPGCDPGLAATWTTLAPGPGTTDCWDKDPKVRPMTTDENNSAWSSTAILGRTTGVDYDYNCDGTEERRNVVENLSDAAYCGSNPPIVFPYVEVPTSSEFQSMSYSAPNSSEVELFEGAPLQIGTVLITLCFGTNGWRGSAPDCGKSGSFSRCSLVSGSCTRETVSLRQECR